MKAKKYSRNKLTLFNKLEATRQNPGTPPKPRSRTNVDQATTNTNKASLLNERAQAGVCAIQIEFTTLTRVSRHSTAVQKPIIDGRLAQFGDHATKPSNPSEMITFGRVIIEKTTVQSSSPIEPTAIKCAGRANK